jgi:hypothetical protein
MTLSMSVGGPHPATDPQARACSWHYARRVYLGGAYYWSAYNTGTWNGTNPYDSSVPGWGTCPVLSDQDVESDHMYQDLPVGYHYYAEDPGLFSLPNQYWRVFASSTIFTPNTVTKLATKSGLGTTSHSAIYYLPALKPGEWIEWERTTSELVGLYWSWDERQNGGATEGGVIGKWYIGEYTFQQHVSGAWGPYNGAPGTADNWWGQASGETVSNWAATQDHLGDTAGGYSDWAPVPSRYWDNLDTMPEGDGIRFSCLPEDMFTDTPPAVEGVGVSIFKYRAHQYMAIKAIVRPSRYRVFQDPGIEDLDWAGVNAIAVAFDDGGKVFY